MFMNIQRARKVKRYQNVLSPLNDLNDKELYQRFRFDRDGIQLLCEMFGEQLATPTFRSRAIPVETQICIGLRYLASNDFQNGVGDSFNISQPSVSNIVTKFINSVNSKLNEFVNFPTTNNEIISNQFKFREIAAFPRVVGCIDCTHIRIQAPFQDENDYFNRKHYHSINVQAVCGPNYKFNNIVAKWPGSTHDSFILRQSELWDAYERNNLQGVILGDSAYPNRKWLMTPFSHPNTPSQVRYNNSHTRTRVTIENSFGRMKRRFSILHSGARILPEKMCKIIGTCAVLHNIATDLGLPDFEEIEDDQPVVPNYDGPLINALEYRRQFAEEVFSH